MSRPSNDDKKDNNKNKKITHRYDPLNKDNDIRTDYVDL
jgi:hypothetical protein